jgi:hypothetical protein
MEMEETAESKLIRWKLLVQEKGLRLIEQISHPDYGFCPGDSLPLSGLCREETFACVVDPGR